MKLNVRNHEHYMDLTAYHALKNIDEERKTGMKKGDIWKVENSYTERYVVIIAADDGDKYGIAVNLYDGDKGIQVKAKDMMVASPGMICYVYEDKLIEFVRTVEDDKMDEIMAAVARKLGLESTNKPKATECITEKEKTVKSENTVELIRAKNAAAIYKNLYTDLLKQVIGRE